MPEENRGPWSKKFENRCCMPNVNSDKISITIAIFSTDLTEKWWLSDIVEA